MFTIAVFEGVSGGYERLDDTQMRQVPTSGDAIILSEGGSPALFRVRTVTWDVREGQEYDATLMLARLPMSEFEVFE